MKAIYRTTQRAGKRLLLALHPWEDAEQALATFARIAGRMGWEYTESGQGVAIKFPDKTEAVYTLEEKENCYLCNTHER